jgi:hypothetical protein|tara:strand:+ start:1266 stop:2333 length:1068 start_codon:yes stop_codon:yes gene_type:complete
MGQMTASNKDNLTILACSFNNDFKQFLASHDSRILPKLKTGIVQQPIDNIYWQKECGCFEASGGDVISKDNEDYVSDSPDWESWDEYDENGNFRLGISYAEKVERDGQLLKTGRYIPVKPHPECLMYVGEWSYLERHSDVKQKEHWYWNTIKRLKDSSFESELSSHPAYSFFIQNVDRVNLHDSFKGSHDDVWLLRVCLLRVVAGAIEIYDNPLRQDMQDEKKQEALDAKLGKLLVPDQRTANAASRLIENVQRVGAEIDWMAQLKDVAERKPYPLVNSTEPKMALVREVSLLSKILLNTSNGHKGRFPTTAIQNILEFINEEMSDSGIQYHLERYDDSNQQPLSSGYRSSDIPF